LLHTWTSWHRQDGTSCDELKELGGWKTWFMVNRYEKFATEHLAKIASRLVQFGNNKVIDLSRISHVEHEKRV
jgi:hypothetical protein